MSAAATDISLTIERTFAAPLASVFDAWTTAEALLQWWRMAPEASTPFAEVDLRVGGVYRLAMRTPDASATYVVGGAFREVDRPNRVSYTWAWEHVDDATNEPTLVTIDLEPAGTSTKMVLTHSGFASNDERDKHAGGWADCIAILETTLPALIK